MASNRIKGITIEIGGDTTKLDKALAGTNKELKDTQAQLKDVNRLLKLDPGNTDLLAQKQRLLSKSVEGTAEKLKTLKEAAAGADEALARQQNFQDKYGPLVKSLSDAKSSYEDLKSKKEEMDKSLETGNISTEEYDKWNAKLDESKKTVKELQKQVDAAKKELGGPMMDQAQFDALQRELVESEKAAKDAEKAFKSFNASAEEINAVANKVADGAGKVADATKGISTAAGVAATGMLAMAANAGRAADDLNTLSKQSGFSTEELQKWQYASDLVDVSVDSIVGAARKMKKNMVSESKETQAAFAQLGVSVRDNSGDIRDATDVFYQLLDGLSNIPNETERDILAMQIFGKSADELAGIIDDGGKALKKLGQEAEDAGLILSQDALDGANAFNDGIDTLKAKAKAAFMESGAALAENLLPALERVVESVSGLLQWFANLDGGTLEVLLSVLLAVAAIAPVASAISTIARTVSLISQGITLLTGALGAFNITSAITTITFGKWALIIGGVVLAVWGLVEAFKALTKSSSEVDTSKLSNMSTSGRGRPSAQPSGRPRAVATSQNLPHLARGAVTRVNSPYLAVVGDNPTEPEIIAPESAIQRAVSRGMAAAGGGRSGHMSISITFAGDLAQLGRVLNPVITVEGQRLGQKLVN